MAEAATAVQEGFAAAPCTTMAVTTTPTRRAPVTVATLLHLSGPCTFCLGVAADGSASAREGPARLMRQCITHVPGRSHTPRSGSARADGTEQSHLVGSCRSNTN